MPNSFPLNLSPRRPIPRLRDLRLVHLRKLCQASRTAKPTIRRPISLIRPPPLSNTKLAPKCRFLLLLPGLDNLLVPDSLPILAILRFSGFLNLELGIGADFGEFASRTEIEDDAFFCWEGADDADPRGGEEAAEDTEALLPLCEVVAVVVVFAVVTGVELGVGAVVDCEEMAHRC